MSNNIRNISNNDSETKVVNDADYICGLKWHSEQAYNNYLELNAEWHEDVVKLKHHKDKASHHLEKLKHHEELAASYNCKLNLNDEKQVEQQKKQAEYDDEIKGFLDCDGYPWMTDENYTDDEIKYMLKIANEYGIYPDSDSDSDA